MRSWKRIAAFLLTAMMLVSLVGCGQAAVPVESSKSPVESSKAPVASEDAKDELIYVGFVQVGAESDWRMANTKSMQETFTEANGYKFEMVDAQQQTEKQITAIRDFIQKDVDYIVLAPNTEAGWDTVLTEAKDAGIPVIIVDRMIETSDDSLFVAWVGSNFKQEGYDAVKAAFEAMIAGDIDVDVECNPLHGPRVESLIKALEAGQSVDKLAYVEEGVFYAAEAASVMPTRAY